MLADLQSSSGDPETILKKGDCKLCGNSVWSNEGRVKLPDDRSYVHQTCHDASQAAGPAICDIAGCSRSTWNGQVNQQYCQTCKSSGGASHGPDCNRKYALREKRQEDKDEELARIVEYSCWAMLGILAHWGWRNSRESE